MVGAAGPRRLTPSNSPNTHQGVDMSNLRAEGRQAIRFIQTYDRHPQGRGGKGG
jgi:hypothetical protein